MKFVVGENTYVTVEEANQILKDYLLEDDPLRDLFLDLTSKDRAKILYQSCLDLSKLRYSGYRENLHQELPFPRATRGGFRSDMDVVKLAQVLNALSFIPDTTVKKTDDDLSNLQRQGIKTYKLGDFEISFGNNSLNNSFKKTKSGIPEKLLSSWLKGSFLIR